MGHDDGASQILVIKLGAVGDFFRAIPIFTWIKDQNLKSNLTLLTTKDFVDLAKSLRIFDDVVTMQRHSSVSCNQITNTRRFLFTFDLVYDLQFVDRTKLYRLLTITHARPVWCCMASERSWPSLILRYKRSCPSIGSFQDIRPNQEALRKFSIAKPFVAIVPFCSASSVWHKQWPLKNFLQIARIMHDKGFHIIVLGGREDLPQAGLFEQHFIKSLVGATELQDLIQIMPHATLAIGNDTGLMHLAELCQVPTVVLMSEVNDSSKAAKGHTHIHYIKSPISEISVSSVAKGLDHLLVDEMPAR